LKWIAMRVVVPVPWAKRVWALPLLTVLGWPKAKARRGRHKTSVAWVRQMMKQGRRWLPERLLGLVGDGGFAAVALALACQEQQVTFVTRLRLEAALSHPPAPHSPGKRGRKPTKGKRQRSLKLWAARSDTPWETVDVDWYGGTRKRLAVFSRTALWYTSGVAPVAIRFVLVRAPAGQLPAAAFLGTELQSSPEQLLAWVVMRWSVEVTFAEARAHLGIETPRQWSAPAIARTTPVLFGLFSFVTVLALRFCPSGPLPVETTAWYHKAEATFSDCLTLVRQQLWRTWFCTPSTLSADLAQFPREAFECLVNDLPLAA
jgi:hypothetical protein